MKTFKRKVSCEDCYLSTYAPFGGCMCTTLGGKSLFECPGAITDKTVRKAHAAALKARPAAGLLGKDSVTKRGFELVNFLDDYGKQCSLQISSRAVCENEDGSVDNPQGYIWLGIDNPTPIILKQKARDLGMPLPLGEVSGWMPYPVPDDVQISTRMHLNAAQVRGLITRLQTWLDAGRFRLESARHESEKAGRKKDKKNKRIGKKLLAKSLWEGIDQLFNSSSIPKNLLRGVPPLAPVYDYLNQEQPLGTVAEPAEPPPASAQQPKNGVAKMKVRIAMNIDLIAEYFNIVADLLATEKAEDYCVKAYGEARMQAEKGLEGAVSDYGRLWRRYKANGAEVKRLAEKKSALEAEIMEKLMAE